MSINPGSRDGLNNHLLAETPATNGREPVVSRNTDVFTLFTTQILASSSTWGGAERSSVALADWLDKQGFRCRFLLYRDTYGIKAHANPRLEEIQLLPGRRRATVTRIAALRRYTRTNPFSPNAPLASGYRTVLHATLAGIRRFSTLMYDTPSLMGDVATSFRGKVSHKIVGYGLRRAAKLGGKTIVNSEFLRDECMRFFGVEAEIVRMGGLRSTTPCRIRPVQGTLQMLSVSRIESNKRIDWMLRSLAELEHGPIPLSHRTDWQLDIAGNGTQIDMLKQMAHELRLDSRVRFRGFVSDEELETLYNQSHLFLMPAVQGYGIPAIESLQRGIPVLLHRESGVSDILLHTPWATVLTGGPEEMTPRLLQAIDGVVDGRHHATPLPRLPTEDEWSEQVARLCGWIP
jgi:glycosyltransferase involved in cell wall biosynthesis